MPSRLPNQVSFRFLSAADKASMTARADALVETWKQSRPGERVVRSDVLRTALQRGLTRLENEAWLNEEEP